MRLGMMPFYSVIFFFGLAVLPQGADALASDSEESVALHGPWDVYIGELVDDTTNDVTPDGRILLPGYLSHPEPESKLKPHVKGVATFKLRIEVPEHLKSANQEIALDVDRFFSVGRVVALIEDERGQTEKRFFHAGDFGGNGKAMRAIYRPGIMPLGQPTVVTLYVQMGNDVISWLGVERAPVLGTFSELARERELELAKSFLVAGLLAFIGFYYLYLFSLRTSIMASLYFACFALMAVVRVLVMSRIAAALFPESDSFGFTLRLELASGSIMGFFFLMYFREVIPDFVNRTLARFFLVALTLHALIMVFVPLDFAYDGLLKAQQTLGLGTVALLVWSLLQALRVKPSAGIRILGVGVLVIAGTVINDILLSQGVIQSIHVIPLGVATLALCQGLVIAIFNARDRKRAEVLSGELNLRNQELRRVGELKDQFLANTSHELRTPLNGIIGLSESILDGVVGKVSPAVEKNMRMIARNGRRLAMLVNDILDFSKLKKGDVSLNIGSVDVSEPIELVACLCRGWAHEKGAEFQFDMSRAGCFVRVDRNRIDQVLLNLVQCLLRHSASKVIRFEVEYTNQEVRLSIVDDGDGLPQDVLGILQTGNVAEALPAGSDGLGLSVTRSLVELQNCALEIKSEFGKGTCFILTMPRAQSDVRRDDQLLSRVSSVGAETVATAIQLESEAGRVRVVEQPEQSGRNVLVVDDEPINGHVLRQMLEFEGHAVTIVETGEAAIELLDHQRFDLILLDLMLPGISGFDVLVHIRRYHEQERIPVLIITARGFASDLSKSFELGADDYVAKPFTRAEVMARINHHLKMTQYNDEMMGVYGRLADEVTERQQLTVSWEDIDTVRNLITQRTAKLRGEEEKLLEEMSKLEELILRADKMAALGQMVSGITHDIANPLGYVVLSASELMRELMVLKSSSGDISRSETAFPGMADLVESIDKEVKTVGRISRAMRDYTRLDSNPVVGVDLSNLVEDCLLIMNHRLGDATVESRCEPGLAITCYRSHLGQVITNLMSNALQATRGQDSPILEIGSRLIPRDGEEGVEIWVADNGPGVPAAIQDKIFDLFFTLREDDGGTGVGLGLCSMVLEEHGGTIEVGVSQQLGGAEFRLWVPCLPQSEVANLALN